MKLHRIILQEKEVDTIGGSAPIPVDVRIISATRRNLEQMVEDGTFREDLYYRLNVINLHLPPLRSRVEDIPPLVQYFIDKLNEEYKLNVEIDKEVIEAFCNYSWHGNVRELENVIKGAYAVCDGLEIISTDLPAKFGIVVTDKSNVDKNISFGSSEKNIDAFNGAQGRILYVLWQEDGISIRSLSTKCGLAITSLTTMLERMENQGLISRVPSETDKRKTLMFLTEKVNALKGEYDSVSDEMGSIYYKGFSEEEITRFEECLDRIRKNLEEQQKS